MFSRRRAGPARPTNNFTTTLRYGTACYCEDLHYCCWVRQPVSLLCSRSAQLRKNCDLPRNNGLNLKDFLPSERRGNHFHTRCLATERPYHAISVTRCTQVELSWNVMAHGDAREGKLRGDMRVKWVASTLHTTSEHGVSSITTADAHTSAASSRPNWLPRRFKWTRTFRRKTKSGFCACAITFQTCSTLTWLSQNGWPNSTVV